MVHSLARSIGATETQVDASGMWSRVRARRSDDVINDAAGGGPLEMAEPRPNTDHSNGNKCKWPPVITLPLCLSSAKIVRIISTCLAAAQIIEHFDCLCSSQSYRGAKLVQINHLTFSMSTGPLMACSISPRPVWSQLVLRCAQTSLPRDSCALFTSSRLGHLHRPGTLGHHATLNQLGGLNRKCCITSCILSDDIQSRLTSS